MAVYEGVHLCEPAILTCSCCAEKFTGRWWWSPLDNNFAVCEECVGGFDIRDDTIDCYKYDLFAYAGIDVE